MNINEPWEAQLNWAEDCKRDSYVFDAIDNQIAGPVSMDEAILVAAAPDLLEACQGAAHILQYCPDKQEKAVALLLAAIKKAKGE